MRKNLLHYLILQAFYILINLKQVKLKTFHKDLSKAIKNQNNWFIIII